MSSAFHIHIGGAGCMIGSSLWKLYSKEQPDVTKKGYIFEEQIAGECPRVLFADLDDRMINQIKKEKIANFKSNQMINWKEDACTHTRACYTIGREILDHCLSSIKQQIEACDKLDQFIITSSISGGTGSGFFSLLTERLIVEYPKVAKCAFLLFPSENMSNSTVDIYNSVLSIQTCVEHCDQVILFDNESMYNALNNQTELDFVDYSHLNNLIAQVISTYTGIQRFNSQSNLPLLKSLNFSKVAHFLVPSYGPICDINDYKGFSSNNNQVKNILNGNYQLYECEQKQSKVQQLLIQRELHNEQILNPYFNQDTQTLYHHCNSKNYQILDSLLPQKQTFTLFANHASIHRTFQKLMNKFEIFQARRSFCHWFLGEGIRNRDIWGQKYYFTDLISHYEELSNQ